MSGTYAELKNGRKLGWLSAGVLMLVLSQAAWALDLDSEISRQNAESAQIVGTLGRQRGNPRRDPASSKKATANDAKNDLNLRLIPAKGHRAS